MAPVSVYLTDVDHIEAGIAWWDDWEIGSYHRLWYMPLQDD